MLKSGEPKIIDTPVQIWAKISVVVGIILLGYFIFGCK